VPLRELLVLLPGAVAMIVVSSAYSSGIAGAAAVQLVLKGLSAAATALVFVTLAHVLRSGSMRATELAIALAAFIALGPFGLSLFIVVPPLVVAAVGIEHARRSAH
jgi:chromate transport protein ChrA